ncbi:MAG: lactate racemase domain-containing protein [Candidatus Bathyarchaeia archaeon]
MVEVEIPYGRETLKLNVEDENLLSIVNPKPTKPLRDVEGAVMRALKKPIIGSNFRSLLASGKRVALAVDNFARPTPAYQILPPILRMIEECGAESRIIIANGGLRAMTDEELEAKLGREVVESGIPIYQNVAKRREDYVFLGVTSYGTPVEVNRAFYDSDVKLGIHTTQMTLWGYGGGGSIVLPGVSSYQTIEWNHRLALSQGSITPGYVGPKNHLRKDIEEAAEISGLNLVLNTILDVEGRIIDLVTGPSARSHKASIEKFDQVYSYRLRRGKVDISISGSFPWDRYMAHACWPISTLDPVTKDGGTIILAAPSPGGLAHFSYLKDYMPATKDSWLRILSDIFYMKQELWHAMLWYPIHLVMQRKRVIIVTDRDNVDSLTDMGVESTTSLDEAYRIAVSRAPKDFKVLIAPYGKWMKLKAPGR